MKEHRKWLHLPSWPLPANQCCHRHHQVPCNLRPLFLGGSRGNPSDCIGEAGIQEAEVEAIQARAPPEYLATTGHKLQGKSLDEIVVVKWSPNSAKK